MYPMQTTGMLTSGENLLYGLLIGIMFGFILERGGFGRSDHIASVFYFRNLRVSQTMVSAILTAATWMIIAVFNGWIDFNAVFIPNTYIWPYVVGGVLFGLGMVMSGWCPGTAAVGIVSGKVDAFVFAIGLLVGMQVYFINFDKIKDFANSSFVGRFTLDKLVGGDLYIAYFITVIICIGLAVFMHTMFKVRKNMEEAK